MWDKLILLTDYKEHRMLYVGNLVFEWIQFVDIKVGLFLDGSTDDL